jgi:hypothetical protein
MAAGCSMPERRYRRTAHGEVVAILAGLDRGFLERCECYFGGGTRIVLELGEYRESRDIDFLCASRDGYRMLRETVADSSLGQVAKKAVALAREVRGDQYGIRTWLTRGAFRIKFEILREARIDLAGGRIPLIPVACLDHAHAFAEKFLANADRGLDASTLSRDAIDLAFMIEGWPAVAAASGLAIAQGAYGAEVDRKLISVTTKLREDRAYRQRCIDGLAIAETKTLATGLAALTRGRWRRKPALP